LDNGSSVFCTGGNNIGRVGILQHIEHHPGSYEIAHIKDASGNTFATRLSNVFGIGEGKNTQVSIPKNKGIRLSLIEERDKRLSRTTVAAAEDDE
jgi:small subunit ribosomal protein S4e